MAAQRAAAKRIVGTPKKTAAHRGWYVLDRKAGYDADPNDHSNRGERRNPFPFSTVPPERRPFAWFKYHQYIDNFRRRHGREPAQIDKARIMGRAACAAIWWGRFRYHGMACKSFRHRWANIFRREREAAALADKLERQQPGHRNLPRSSTSGLEGV